MAGPKPGLFLSGHFAFGAALDPGGGPLPRVLSFAGGDFATAGTVWLNAVLRLCSHGWRQLF
jgi:hypothetical protein